jgi:hypothetical protein
MRVRPLQGRTTHITAYRRLHLRLFRFGLFEAIYPGLASKAPHSVRAVVCIRTGGGQRTARPAFFGGAKLPPGLVVDLRLVGGARLQPQRDGRVRCSALGGILIFCVGPLSMSMQLQK